MKQLPHVKAEQRKIKWLFEVFNASLRCLVHLLEQFLGQYVLFLRVWVKKGTTQEKQNKRTLKMEQGRRVQWESNPSYVTIVGVVSY